MIFHETLRLAVKAAMVRVHLISSHLNWPRYTQERWTPKNSCDAC